MHQLFYKKIETVYNQNIDELVKLFKMNNSANKDDNRP